MFLDLTSMFDTIEHSVLNSNLEHWLEIKGAALDWFCSYLADRSFCFGTGEVMSFISASLPWSATRFDSWTPSFFSLSAFFELYFEET